MEYRVLKRTDEAWLLDTYNRTRNLACDLSTTLKIGDVIAYDPLLATGNRRICRFDIGEVTLIEYPYKIEVSTFKSNDGTEYEQKSKIKIAEIHRDTIRYKFSYNPATVSGIGKQKKSKIKLSDETFATITKNFHNGK